MTKIKTKVSNSLTAQCNECGEMINCDRNSVEIRMRLHFKVKHNIQIKSKIITDKLISGSYGKCDEKVNGSLFVDTDGEILRTSHINTNMKQLKKKREVEKIEKRNK